jgi:hypothetical protein
LKKRTLSVADFRILLQSKNASEIGLEDSYVPFKINNESGIADVKITSVRGIPSYMFTSNEILFESKDDFKKHFSVYEEADSYKFFVYNPLIKNKVQKIALLKKDYSEWIIYSDVPEKDEEVFPLLYPMGPLVFYYLTVKYDAIMIHASAIFDGEQGRVFSGFSGSGKSTLAGLWQNSGSIIINDDRLMIRIEDGGFFVYNTPMNYVDVPKKMQLHSLYIIEQSNENRIERIKGATSVSGVIAFCIQHGYDRKFIEHHLNFLSELCMNIPVYKLGFINDKKIIDFIKRDGA